MLHFHRATDMQVQLSAHNFVPVLLSHTGCNAVLQRKTVENARWPAPSWTMHVQYPQCGFCLPPAQMR